MYGFVSVVNKQNCPVTTFDYIVFFPDIMLEKHTDLKEPIWCDPLRLTPLDVTPLGMSHWG